MFRNDSITPPSPWTIAIMRTIISSFSHLSFGVLMTIIVIMTGFVTSKRWEAVQMTSHVVASHPYSMQWWSCRSLCRSKALNLWGWKAHEGFGWSWEEIMKTSVTQFYLRFQPFIWFSLHYLVNNSVLTLCVWISPFFSSQCGRCKVFEPDVGEKKTNENPVKSCEILLIPLNCWTWPVSCHLVLNSQYSQNRII